MDQYPDITKITWKKGGELITTGLKTYRSVRNKDGTYTQSSQFTLPGSAVDCSSKIYCEVQHSGTHKSKEMPCPGYTVHHDYTVKILPPPVEQVLLEATVTLSCIVSNLPSGVNVNWIKEKKPLKLEIDDQSGQNPDSAISKLDISTEAWLSGVTFECLVYHQNLPAPLRDSIHKKKVSVLLPPTEEISAERFLALTCLVRGFFPREIFVKWTNNDKPVNPSNDKNTEVMVESNNTSFFMYSLFSITVEEWASGATYSCVVGHEAIPLKIINRTVDKSSGKPSL
ncbi:hypothetical protein chiPu_0018911 [Chiloscyllium punctatum]|uniref:Ig-like domain-containing protein n=1 Tax=Chiloscyllium punctatum TaxID=137246 RepID=A0A401RQD3_CHIPU|nr:hypothetical protein [Chiloscyllium punctatum]